MLKKTTTYSIVGFNQVCRYLVASNVPSMTENTELLACQSPFYVIRANISAAVFARRYGSVRRCPPVVRSALWRSPVKTGFNVRQPGTTAVIQTGTKTHRSTVSCSGQEPETSSATRRSLIVGGHTSQTSISHFGFCAGVARDFAAPMEYAVTSFSGRVCHRSISTIAAHQVTTVNANRGRVALAPSGALEADRIVSLAVIRRILVVHQVSQTRWLVVAVNRNKIEPPRPFPPISSVDRVA